MTFDDNNVFAIVIIVLVHDCVFGVLSQRLTSNCHGLWVCVRWMGRMIGEADVQVNALLHR